MGRVKECYNLEHFLHIKRVLVLHFIQMKLHWICIEVAVILGNFAEHQLNSKNLTVKSI